MASTTPEVDIPARRRVRRRRRYSPLSSIPWPPAHLTIVLIGIAALVVPTLLTLAREYWSTDTGVHGPLIFVSGAWLVWRERPNIHFRPGSISARWLLALLPLLVVYAYGRVFNVLIVETASLYATLILLGFYYWGPEVMRRVWFAILYLGFLIRPPGELTAELTQPLKIWLSSTTISVLHYLGYPVGSSGVAIQVAQYELLVQDACSGLGSLFSLFAIGLLYLHLTDHSSRARNVILLLSIIPMAVLANLVRVVGIVLLTFYFGDSVAQGVAHDMMGLMTFAVAVLGMFVLDGLLRLVIPGRLAQSAMATMKAAAE